MREEDRDQLTPEVLNFMRRVEKNVNYNPYFVNSLEYEISHILLNKGKLALEDGILVGKYTSKANVWQRLTGKIRQTLTVTTGKAESCLIVECPEVTYICDNIDHIYYGKEAKSYYRSSTTYSQDNLKKTPECQVCTINNHSANISPVITHVSNRNCETIINYDSDNEDIFYKETENRKEGYQDFRNKKFIKYGSDVSDKSITTINRLVNYSIIDVVEVNNGEQKNQKFIVESNDSKLAHIANCKQSWRALSPSEYMQIMRDKEVLEEVEKKLTKKV